MKKELETCRRDLLWYQVAELSVRGELGSYLRVLSLKKYVPHTKSEALFKES